MLSVTSVWKLGRNRKVVFIVLINTLTTLLKFLLIVCFCSSGAGQYSTHLWRDEAQRKREKYFYYFQINEETKNKSVFVGNVQLDNSK